MKKYFYKRKIEKLFLISNQSLEEILHRKIQLLSYGIAEKSYKDCFSKADTVSSEDIKIVHEVFQKSLSISGDKQICGKLKKNG